MAALSHNLSLAEFETQYSGAKPYYEFWFGEAIQKSMPTWIHGMLQIILGAMLRESGYRAGSEVKLRIDPEFQPVPDLVATKGRIEALYPSGPLEIVVEILSDDDPMSRLLTKCRKYQSCGIEEIYVVDPSARLVFRWLDHRLEETQLFAGLPVARIWAALDLPSALT